MDRASAQGVISHEYHGQEERADLLGTGVIAYEGRQYESPSAFSIYVKRKTNPMRKADDGWKSVRYKGTLLEEFKKMCKEGLCTYFIHAFRRDMWRPR